jgi:hypothetical protein
MVRNFLFSAISIVLIMKCSRVCSNFQNDPDDLFTSLDRMRSLVKTHNEITKYLKQIVSYQTNILELNKK